MPLQIIREDITRMRVDAIVNTTNEEMVGYSGVDLAVHTVAGEELDAECRELAPLGLGQAKISGAYKLPCKYVIHTSGPVWRGGLVGESIILRSCYIESLKLAVKHKCRSVAFPLISSGVYCYPKDQVLKFAIQTITEFLFDHELTVYLCVFDKESYSFSQKLFNDIQAFIDDEYVDEHDEDFYDLYEFDTDEIEATKCIQPPQAPMCADACIAPRKKETSFVAGKTLHEYLKQRDQSFQEMLFDLIDRSGMTDVECYKKANVDRKLFSKIRNNPDYKPSKTTALAFAIALELSLEETKELIGRAGYALSHSRKFDVIIEYFIKEKKYDIFEINEALFAFDQSLLGA